MVQLNLPEVDDTLRAFGVVSELLYSRNQNLWLNTDPCLSKSLKAVVMAIPLKKFFKIFIYLFCMEDYIP